MLACRQHAQAHLASLSSFCITCLAVAIGLVSCTASTDCCCHSKFDCSPHTAMSNTIIQAWVCLEMQIKDELLELLAAACVMIAGKQGERPSAIPSEADLEAAIGLQVHQSVLILSCWHTAGLLYSFTGLPAYDCYRQMCSLPGQYLDLTPAVTGVQEGCIPGQATSCSADVLL